MPAVVVGAPIGSAGMSAPDCGPGASFASPASDRLTGAGGPVDHLCATAMEWLAPQTRHVWARLHRGPRAHPTLLLKKRQTVPLPGVLVS